VCTGANSKEQSRLAARKVYIISGDGTMRGAVKIFEGISRRKLNIAIAGIPKTVDNDIGIIDQSWRGTMYLSCSLC
ncbi:hypothetical protein Droror1_Dr00008592, partial [Drosera rotundifolia]